MADDKLEIEGTFVNGISAPVGEAAQSFDQLAAEIEKLNADSAAEVEAETAKAAAIKESIAARESEIAAYEAAIAAGEGLTESQVEVAAAAQGVAARMAEEAAGLDYVVEAATAASAAQKETAAVVTDLGVAESVLARQLASAAENFANFGEIAAGSGKDAALATDILTKTITALGLSIERVQALGGVVTPAMTEQVAAYRAQLAALTVTTEEGAVADTSAARAKALLNAEMNAARGNVGGLARAVGALVSGPMAQLILVPLLVEAAFKILPQIIDSISKGLTAAGEAIGNFGNQNDKVGESLKKTNEEATKADQTYKKLADSIDETARMTAALNAGLIVNTDNTKLLAAEEASRLIRLRAMTDITKEFADKLKAVGFQIAANAEDLQVRETTAFNLYENLVQTKGIDAANRWAVANKKTLQSIMDDAQEAGVGLTEDFQGIADAAGITSKSMEELDKSIKKLETSMKSENDTLHQQTERLAEHVRELRAATTEKIRLSDEAFKHVTANYFEEVKALNVAHDAMTISDQAYRDKFAALQLKMVDDRRKHDAEQDVLRKAEELKEKEGELAEAIRAEKIKGHLTDEDKQLGVLLTAKENFNTESKRLNEELDIKLGTAHQQQMHRIQEQNEAYGSLSDAIKKHVDISVEQMKVLATQTGKTTEAIKNLQFASEHLGTSSPTTPGVLTPGDTHGGAN